MIEHEPLSYEDQCSELAELSELSAALCSQRYVDACPMALGT